MATMARWCVQRRAWVLIGWLALLALLALLAVLGVTGRAAGSTYSDALTLPGTGSTTAQNLLEQAFPGHAGDQDTIVWRARSGSVSAPAARHRITAMLGKVAAAPAGGSVISPYSARGAPQVSRNGQIAYAPVVFDAPQPSLPVPDVTRVVHLAEAARAPGVQVDIGGPAVENALRPSVGISAGVGVIAAAIVLFIAFGSLLAMLLPLAIAIFALVSGPMATGLLSHAVTIPSAARPWASCSGCSCCASVTSPAWASPRRSRCCSRWPPPPPCCPRCSASSGCGSCPGGNGAGWRPTGPRPTAPPGRGPGWPRSCS